MQDAHLHLQDSRFQDVDSIISEMRSAGVERCVVNGTCPDDWERVQLLAMEHPDLIIPSYGLHPWKTPCDQNWKPLLREYLSRSPIPCIGECGLDRWIKDFDTSAQQDSFLYQLDLACEMNAPISVHILKAWGWFMDILRARKLSYETTGKFFPQRGFLLHSYNGSAELIPELVAAGAYFSFSGYFLNERKQNQLRIFSHIPIERLLIETDSPDMLPPEEVITYPLSIAHTKSSMNSPINHPANLGSILEHLAQELKLNPLDLESQLADNFSRFFLSKYSLIR
ncbi:MAG: TatD family hydrolase [Rubritalea sp.]